MIEYGHILKDEKNFWNNFFSEELHFISNSVADFSPI